MSVSGKYNTFQEKAANSLPAHRTARMSRKMMIRMYHYESDSGRGGDDLVIFGLRAFTKLELYM